MSIGQRNRTLAVLGEDRAADYVTGLGWSVLERNWRCRWGELDLVAHDVTHDTLVFAEVKARRGLGYGHPLEAITRDKAARLRVLAAEWLRTHATHAPGVRIDAIGVLFSPGGRCDISHVRGIGDT